MDTLVAVGTLTAYTFSVVELLRAGPELLFEARRADRVLALGAYESRNAAEPIRALLHHENV